MRTLMATAALFMTCNAGLADVPRVVTDIGPVRLLVNEVLQGAGAADVILPPGASPHSYAMRPSEARALTQADLVVWVGPALTPWLEEPLETLAGDARHLTLTEAEGILLLPFRSGGLFADHGHDHGEHGAHEGDSAHDEPGTTHDYGGHDDEHSHDAHADHNEDHDGHEHDAHADHDNDHNGHDHDAHTEHDKDHADDDGEHNHDAHADHAGGIDPHLWLDPQNAVAILRAVSAALSGIDPENAALYAENAEAAARRISNTQKLIETSLAPVRSRPFVVSHDAYHYFEARFGTEALGAVSLADGEGAGASQLARIRAAVAEVGAVCVLTDPASQPGLIAAATESGTARTEMVDLMGSREAMTDYVAYLQDMAAVFHRCLSPE